MTRHRMAGLDPVPATVQAFAADTLAARAPLAAAASDAQGAFRLGGLAPGRYRVRASFVGFVPAERVVTLPGAEAALTFRLAPDRSELEEVVVRDRRDEGQILTRLRPVDLEGVALYESKKNEVVVLDALTANLAANTSRQIYARVAGLNIWESDEAGVQIGLGGRGLSPNRNANFNTRQNGYDIAADALGYPESYYTPPAQALERVEIVRGAASLQYGTQFGGLVNFVFRRGADDVPVRARLSQTVGSYGLRVSFADAGGTVGRTRYYGFYQRKASDGWRPNAGLHQHTAFASAHVQATRRLSVRPEFTFMRYLAQQPGGLTDAQFARDAGQSTRARNWFGVDWNLLALRADYDASDRTTFNARLFGLVAGRDALGNLGRIDRTDDGGPRDLLVDRFRNWGGEARAVHRYAIRGLPATLLVGGRYYRGFTRRRQGLGPDGSDARFVYLNPDDLEGSDYDLPSRNASLFAEHVFNLTSQISLTPGVRAEYIRTAADGTYRTTVRDLAGNVLLDERTDEERTSERAFVFFGLGASYRAGGWEVYANASQNYRAITFNDLRVQVGSLEVDPDLQDERGFNADLGLRGARGPLALDVSAFYLAYRDRIGTLLRTEPNPVFNNLVDRTFRLRTNVADARIYGLEALVEARMWRRGAQSVSAFVNAALLGAAYDASAPSDVAGNRVELVPSVNLKAGVEARAGRLRTAAQVAYVGEQFSDATNAERVPSAIEGVIPAYHVVDLSAAYEVGQFEIGAGVNNLTDARYFTRRATGYPGPGIIPAPARSLYATVTLTL
jgi:Fe(3+) dicitrate transport protein